ELEADEPADLDVLADLRDQLLLELLDRLVGILHERLIEQADLLHPLRDLTVDHLRDHGLGLAALLGLREQDLALARDDVLGDLVLAHELRVHRRDLHRDVAGERLEVLVARDEVGLAVDLDEHADAAARVDVRDDGAFGGLTAGLLRRLRETLRAQVVDRLVHVTRDFGERLLAVRHAGAGALAQILDERCSDFHCDYSASGEAEASGLNIAPPVEISTRGPSPPDDT